MLLGSSEYRLTMLLFSRLDLFCSPAWRCGEENSVNLPSVHKLHDSSLTLLSEEKAVAVMVRAKDKYRYQILGAGGGKY